MIQGKERVIAKNHEMMTSLGAFDLVILASEVNAADASLS